MKLSTRILMSTVAITTGFAILILALLFQYSSSVVIAAEYAEQIQPAQETIEHLLATIYSDFLLVEEYMLVTDYTTLSDYDDMLEHSEEQCEALTDEFDDLITLKEITDEDVIKNYNTAVLVYSSWQRSRDTLLSLHKESVATRVVRPQEIREERERFIALMQNATAHFTASLEQLNKNNVETQKQLSSKTKTTQTLLIVLLFSFVAISAISSYMLIQRLAKPLDQMSSVSVDFTKGNYKARVDENSSVAEISSLQQQLNRVYKLIDSSFTTKDQKDKASQQLLPAQYKEILDHIKLSNTKGTMLTMKDIKKHFTLTHPTVVSRLRYLEKNGYIYIKKQGRNKYLFEAN